jgi:hypothetical protein
LHNLAIKSLNLRLEEIIILSPRGANFIKHEL